MFKPFQTLVLSSVLVLVACGQSEVQEEQVQYDEVAVLAEPEAKAREKRRVMLMSAKAKPSPAKREAYIRQQVMMDTAANTEKYPKAKTNSVKQVSADPVSTFSIDVDTAAYSNVRRLLNQGALPPHYAVRVEEMVNYFSYDYPQPESQPFSVYTEMGPSPYNAHKQLLHIGIQGKKVQAENRPASNLVFLVDVSGSMRSANKIGLLKNALKMLSRQMTAKDKVALVVYAGAAGVVLEPTAGDQYQTIADALERLAAGGSTNGGAGINAAYGLAQQHFIKDGINRVILATDGDFNVGTVDQDALKNLIEQKRKSGIELSILGFGMGNYNDALMQELAQNGNGNAYYIDNLNEARKVLVEELSATLQTIAKDVKIQIEFNPDVVSEYRLIGYETRHLNREDFNNDKIDAGEIGAGHTVTAIYELALTGSKGQMVDDLRYQSSKAVKAKTLSNELAFLRLRYKQPDATKSQLIEIPLLRSAMKSTLAETSDNYQFSAAVAGFGQLLRGGDYTTTMSIPDVLALAQQGKGKDQNGYRGEFIQLVKLAQALMPAEAPATTE